MTVGPGVEYWRAFPPAEEIEKWNALYPNEQLGLRAFAMVERQQRHEHRITWAGIGVSTLIAMAALVSSVYFFGQGNTGGGSALALSSAAGIVTTYLTRLLSNRSAEAPSQTSGAGAAAPGSSAGAA